MSDEVEQQFCGPARLQEPIPGKTKRAKLKPGQEEGTEERQPSESGVNKQPDRSSKTKIKSQPRLAKNRALLTLNQGDPARLWRRCSVYSCRKSFFGGCKKPTNECLFYGCCFFTSFLKSILCARETDSSTKFETSRMSVSLLPPLPFFFLPSSQRNSMNMSMRWDDFLMGRSAVSLLVPAENWFRRCLGGTRV